MWTIIVIHSVCILQNLMCNRELDKPAFSLENVCSIETNISRQLCYYSVCSVSFLIKNRWPQLLLHTTINQFSHGGRSITWFQFACRELVNTVHRERADVDFVAAVVVAFMSAVADWNEVNVVTLSYHSFVKPMGRNPWLRSCVLFISAYSKSFCSLTYVFSILHCETKTSSNEWISFQLKLIYQWRPYSNFE